MTVSAICKIEHEAKLSALLALRQHANWFISCIARARPCFNSLRDLPMNTLVTRFNLASYMALSTSSSQVTQNPMQMLQ